MAHSNSAEIEIGELFGLTDLHLISIPDSQLKMHTASLAAFSEMQQAAAEQDIRIHVASAYRSFDRQLSIWNAKVVGERACLDDSGKRLELSEMPDLDAVQAIMRFSALPGASRHHWGTDLDIYDAAAVSDDYQLQLIDSEYREGGPFYNLHLWLTENAHKFDFLRPYQLDRGGVAPEAWHISHQPVAQKYQSAIDLELLTKQLCLSELKLKDVVLNNLQYLFERYIQIT